MNCLRAFEIDLEDVLLTPDSAECREFEAHAETCADCAGELAMHRGLLSRLADEPSPSGRRHPSDALLLRFRRDPAALSDTERREIHAHLAQCLPCDNAYRATLALVPEPQRSALASSLAKLREWLSSAGVPAWAGSAAALLLVAGLLFSIDPFGTSPTPDSGKLILRGRPPAAITIELEPGRRAALARYGLEDDQTVQLLVEVPAPLRDRNLEVRVTGPNGDRIHAGRFQWDADDPTRGWLELPAGAFDLDTYLVTLVAADGESVVYPVDVRLR